MIYSWPKGRIIRTLLTVCLIGIGIDFAIGANGSFNAWQRSVGEDQATFATLLTAIVYAVCAAVITLGGLWAVLLSPKYGQFLIEAEKEMTKVTWPGRPEVIRSTIIIAILTVVLTLLIFGVDSINQWVVFKSLLGVDRT